MEIVYRHFPCDGLCGNYIDVPTHIASKIMKPNGTILPHDEVLCPACSMWFEYEIDLIDQNQFLLPAPR